jgi:hypothetical protein
MKMTIHKVEETNSAFNKNKQNTFQDKPVFECLNTQFCLCRFSPLLRFPNSVSFHKALIYSWHVTGKIKILNKDLILMWDV